MSTILCIGIGDLIHVSRISVHIKRLREGGIKHFVILYRA